MDPALIAIVGTASGAAATGLVDVVKVIVQGRQQHKVEEAKRQHDAAEAQAQREADAAEREAQRKHDAAQARAQRDAAQRAERAEQIGVALGAAPHTLNTRTGTPTATLKKEDTFPNRTSLVRCGIRACAVACWAPADRCISVAGTTFSVTTTPLTCWVRR